MESNYSYCFIKTTRSLSLDRNPLLRWLYASLGKQHAKSVIATTTKNADAMSLLSACGTTRRNCKKTHTTICFTRRRDDGACFVASRHDTRRRNKTKHHPATGHRSFCRILLLLARRLNRKSADHQGPGTVPEF